MGSISNSLSAIIPTWNESANVAAAIASLRCSGADEVVVVDGGSTDDTIDAAAGADQVLIGPAGRAAQMNAGAAVSHGDLLLFLHADCTLEAGALQEARQLLGRHGICAVCFAMHVQAACWTYRCIDACATARVRLTNIAYGDQGLLVRRDVFARCGGFPPYRFMEDVVLSLALRRLGRIAVTSKRIFVSPRRWKRVGVVRQTLLNWSLTALASMGVHPDRLADWYERVR